MDLGSAAATAPVAAYCKNPRRSTAVLSSAIGALRDQGNPSLQNFRLGILGGKYLTPSHLRWVLVLSELLHPQPQRSEHYNERNLMARRRHSCTERTFA